MSFLESRSSDKGKLIINQSTQLIYSLYPIKSKIIPQRINGSLNQSAKCSLTQIITNAPRWKEKVDEHETLLVPEGLGGLHSEAGGGKLGVQHWDRNHPGGGGAVEALPQHDDGILTSQLRERPCQGKTQHKRETWPRSS